MTAPCSSHAHASPKTPACAKDRTIWSRNDAGGAPRGLARLLLAHQPLPVDSRDVLHLRFVGPRPHSDMTPELNLPPAPWSAFRDQRPLGRSDTR